MRLSPFEWLLHCRLLISRLFFACLSLDAMRSKPMVLDQKTRQATGAETFIVLTLRAPRFPNGQYGLLRLGPHQGVGDDPLGAYQPSGGQHRRAHLTQ